DMLYLVLLLFFFFSSRRRHTRSKRDWSSDVCSSDLRASARSRSPVNAILPMRGLEASGLPASRPKPLTTFNTPGGIRSPTKSIKIGRASCRERAGGEDGGGA